jgi:AraC-like DNA-binding protein
LRFCTDDLPEHERLPYWREVVGRSIARLDIQPLADGPFHGRVSWTRLPNCHLMHGGSSAAESRRTPALIADSNDDLVLAIVQQGKGLAEQCGRQALAAHGDAVLLSAGEVGRVRGMPRYLKIRAPLQLLKPAAPGLEDRIACCIPRNNPALRLLTSYFDAWRQGELAAAPELSRTLDRHLLDLLALTLGASGDAAELASRGGGRAARRALIGRELDKGYLDPHFSLPALANRLGVSPRYVQMLLEEANSSFVKEVTERRLKLATELLRSPRYRGFSVANIAHECGFVTMAHFHRLFRRRYGVTPGELRAASARP